MYVGPEYRQIMVRRARAQAALISRYASGGTCVDAGCGIGALVARLSALGWNARGFDGDLEVIGYGAAKFGASITVGSIHEFLKSGSRVDLICLSHVVEHLNDLLGTLSRLIEAVRPGGYLFVEVPNEVSMPVGDMESHLHFFTRGSLTAALQACGLEVLFCSACGPGAPAAPTLPVRGFPDRVARALRARMRRILRKTDWDGWYDHYSDNDHGLWLRCIARRPG